MESIKKMRDVESYDSEEVHSNNIKNTYDFLEGILQLSENENISGKSINNFLRKFQRKLMNQKFRIPSALKDSFEILLSTIEDDIQYFSEKSFTNVLTRIKNLR